MLDKIYKIKNIESISIKDIVQSVSEAIYVIPMLIVTYDGNKSMALCSRDKYFDEFVKKVTEVYKDEKDNIYEDGLTDPFGFRKSIRIDEHSKQILESKELLDVRSMYEHYDNLDSYDESLLFQSDEVETLMPIVQYHLTRFLEFTDTSLKVDPSISGYRNRYAMNGSLNGFEKFFPFLYTKASDNHYLFSITGILENKQMNVAVDYKQNGIAVHLFDDDLGLYAEYTYEVLNGVVRRKEDFTLRGLSVHFLNEDLKMVDNPYPNISSFDYQADFKYFKLPWNGVYGIRTNVEALNGEECKTEVASSIIECAKSSFTRRDAYLLQYKRKDTPTRKGEAIMLEEFSSILTGVKLKNNPNHYAIETKFLDTGMTSGYYGTHLNGKCFYHLVYSDDPIDRAVYKSDIAVTHETINKKSDFDNTSLVKQLVRGV